MEADDFEGYVTRVVRRAHRRIQAGNTARIVALVVVALVLVAGLFIGAVILMNLTGFSEPPDGPTGGFRNP